MLKKYYANYGHSYHYKNKKLFISDLCQTLQTLKKQYIQTKKINRRTKRIQFKVIMILDNPHEEWFFNIYVGEDFEINLCMLRLDNDKQIKFWSEDLKITKNDTSYNICKNITYFRKWLNDTVGYEDA